MPAMRNCHEVADQLIRWLRSAVADRLLCISNGETHWPNRMRQTRQRDRHCVTPQGASAGKPETGHPF